VGTFGIVRGMNIKNYDPRDEIALGPDTWMVFPARAKAGLMRDDYTTGNQGFAIRKAD
jgi:hypothetical protein